MPKKTLRTIDFVPEHHEYGTGKTSVTLTLSELEAMRLVDLLGMSQIEAAESMEISRATVQRLLQSGRKKMVTSVMYKERIVLKADDSMEGGKMKLAFINVNGMVGGHLGHAKNITLYDFENNNFSNHTPEVSGGGARAKWLYDAGAKAIVLTSSGKGAINHMSQMGIEVFDGNGLSIEEALLKYKENELKEFSLDSAHSGCGGHDHHHDSKTECCEGDDDDCCGGEEKEHKHHGHGHGGCGCH